MKGYALTSFCVLPNGKAGFIVRCYRWDMAAVDVFLGSERACKSVCQALNSALEAGELECE